MVMRLWCYGDNLPRLLLQDNLCTAASMKQMLNTAGVLNLRLGDELEVDLRLEIQPEMKIP